VNYALLDIGFVAAVLAASIRIAAPILFVALGEALAESAGILNVAVEGMMALGALSGLVVAAWTGSPWIGFAAAFVIGSIAGCIFGMVTIECGADQVVTGIVFNLFCFGLCSLIYHALFATAVEVPQIEVMPPLAASWFHEIPATARVVFSQSPIVYIGFASIPVFWLLLFRTNWGLQVRAVGESPGAAISAGVDIWRIRLTAIVVGGAMAATGGAALSIGQIGGYLDNITGGRGFIALAVVAFGAWNPLRIGGAALLFGMAEALELRFQASSSHVPHELFIAFPYLLTIIVVAAFAGSTRYPAATNSYYPRPRRLASPLSQNK
jgi:general nucleoside transport system permease protein